MNLKKNNKYFKWGLTAFLVICACIIFYYILFHGEHLLKNLLLVAKILSPVLYGVVIAYLLTPILNFIQYKILTPICNLCKWKESPKRTKVLRAVSVLFTMVFILGLISAIITVIISEIVPSIINITENSDTYMENASIWLTDLLDGNPTFRDYAILAVEKYSKELEKILNDTLLQKGSEVLKTVSLSVISVFKVFWNFILGFIISVYLLSGKEKLTGEAKRLIYAFYSEKKANIILNNFKFSHKTFSGFISGKVVDSIIIGILCFIGTSILRTPYAVLVSVLVGITNIIPFFGPFIGAIPSCILILLVDPLHPLNVVYFIIFILILQQVDGNIIGPKILGSSTGLTGFWVIFAITVFGGLFGIIGIIAGVPLFAVIYAAVRAYIEMRLTKKKLDVNSATYTNVNGIIDGVYSTFEPEYTLTKKKQKEQQAQPTSTNLLKQYGDKFICEFNKEDLVESESDASGEQNLDQVTSTSNIITENPN